MSGRYGGDRRVVVKENGGSMMLFGRSIGGELRVHTGRTWSWCRRRCRKCSWRHPRSRARARFATRPLPWSSSVSSILSDSSAEPIDKLFLAQKRESFSRSNFLVRFAHIISVGQYSNRPKNPPSTPMIKTPGPRGAHPLLACTHTRVIALLLL